MTAPRNIGSIPQKAEQENADEVLPPGEAHGEGNVVLTFSYAAVMVFVPSFKSVPRRV